MHQKSVINTHRQRKFNNQNATDMNTQLTATSIKPICEKQSIYGAIHEIAGAVLLTNILTGAEKYFIVCRPADNAENRELWNAGRFEDWYWECRLTSDFSGISQHRAELMPQIKKTQIRFLPKRFE